MSNLIQDGYIEYFPETEGKFPSTTCVLNNVAMSLIFRSTDTTGRYDIEIFVYKAPGNYTNYEDLDDYFETVLESDNIVHTTLYHFEFYNLSKLKDVNPLFITKIEESKLLHIMMK